MSASSLVFDKHPSKASFNEASMSVLLVSLNHAIRNPACKSHGWLFAHCSTSHCFSCKGAALLQPGPAMHESHVCRRQCRQLAARASQGFASSACQYSWDHEISV